MSDLEGEEPSLGDTLVSKGWQQGVLFASTDVSFVWNSLSSLEASTSVVKIEHRVTKARERFVLVSQTCDIVSREENYVEALICKSEKREYCIKVDRNSARRFVIDPVAGLVAQAMRRVMLAKEVLGTLIPELWPSSPDRFDRFVRWLARRYDRPAVPDSLVAAFQAPVEQALAQLDMTAPTIGAAFTHAVRELRINIPASEYPPYDLQLVMLLAQDSLSEEQGDALYRVIETIRNVIDPNVVHLHREVRILSEAEMSLAEYLATRPLYLEYLTYQGDEIAGSPPLPRA